MIDIQKFSITLRAEAAARGRNDVDVVVVRRVAPEQADQEYDRLKRQYPDFIAAMHTQSLGSNALVGLALPARPAEIES